MTGRLLPYQSGSPAMPCRLLGPPAGTYFDQADPGQDGMVFDYGSTAPAAMLVTFSTGEGGNLAAVGAEGGRHPAVPPKAQGKGEADAEKH